MEPSKEMPDKVSRLVAALLALLLVLVALWGGLGYWRGQRAQRQLEAGYRRAVEEAAMNLSNISSDLVKGLYCGSPAQLGQVSAKLWKEASSAGSALAVLPLSSLHLDKTSRFLSQVGDYAMALSRKCAQGEDLTAAERQQFLALREYADRLQLALSQLEQQLDSGELNLLELERRLAREGQDPASVDTDDKSTLPVTNSSLDAMEEGFSAYPTLIYDGPFSDHILSKSPQLQKQAQPVDEATAQAAAQQVAATLGLGELTESRLENSTLPCYVFYREDCSVAITKHGGRLCYLICPPAQEGEAQLSLQQARDVAQKALTQLGFEGLAETYYQEQNGLVTVNYAYEQGDVRCYTDLVKITVSRQSGKVCALDARGYWVNHQERQLPEPALGVEAAQEKLSPLLTVEQSRLALIPSQGQQERLCWEFRCQGSAGDTVLCYINATSGAEEQLLLLLESEEGTLTK